MSKRILELIEVAFGMNSNELANDLNKRCTEMEDMGLTVEIGEVACCSCYVPTDNSMYETHTCKILGWKEEKETSYPRNIKKNRFRKIKDSK